MDITRYSTIASIVALTSIARKFAFVVESFRIASSVSLTPMVLRLTLAVEMGLSQKIAFLYTRF